MSGTDRSAAAGKHTPPAGSTIEGSSALPEREHDPEEPFEGDDVPETLFDALIETAWSLPGLRISYARYVANHRLRFLASVGTDGVPDITGWKLSLERAPELLEVLQGDDAPVAIEDVRVDPRTKPLGRAFEELNVGSLLVAPLRDGHPSELIGVLTFHCASPRTWSAKDTVALERVQPLAFLSLENARLTAALAQATTKLREHDRHAGASRGVIDGVLHDARVLTDALGRESGSPEEPPGAIVRMLDEVLQELGALQDGAYVSRVEETIDLGEVVRRIAPVLRGIIGPSVRLLMRCPSRSMRVRGSTIGVLRLVLHLVQYARRSDPPGAEIVLQARMESGEGPTLVIAGDGLGLDDALIALGDHPQKHTHPPAELHRDLWQARSELLLQGATMAVEGDPQKGARLRIAFRPAD